MCQAQSDDAGGHLPHGGGHLGRKARVVWQCDKDPISRRPLLRSSRPPRPATQDFLRVPVRLRMAAAPPRLLCILPCPAQARHAPTSSPPLPFPSPRRHKESKLGLRWRTEKEVISGKGQFICGAKGCDKRDGLCSYEVNFAYTEAGQQRQALVKLRLCSGCAYKLNYRKEKQYRKAEAKRRRSRGDGSGDDSDEGGGGSGGGGGAARSARERAAQFLIDQLTAGASEYDPAKAVAPPPGKSEAALAQEGAEARRQRERQEQEQQATMPATEEVWEQKPVQEASAEEEFEQYFEGMFL